MAHGWLGRMTDQGQAAEHPYAVREISSRIAQAIAGWPRVWVEGQLTEVNVRGTWAYAVLRDAEAEMSIRLAGPAGVLERAAVGNRVVVLVQPEWRANNGSLSFRVHAVQAVGLGELLARLERLRALLAAEGLFAPERKRALPVLPSLVGLICGRESDAKHDVITNATKRWPHVCFEVAEVAVQGPSAVEQVGAALQRLDADPRVDVIVIARGGGAFEDLLPFSDEGLLRRVAACRTPVVSAIGHEQDRPLLDDVADVRASTPTDAARRIVPDMEAELTGIERQRRRARQRVEHTLERERQHVLSLRNAVTRAHPARVLEARLDEVRTARIDARRAIALHLERRLGTLTVVRARLTAMSPQATLDRGFAVVRRADGTVITDPAALTPEPIDIRVAAGSFRATPILEDHHA